MKSFVFILSFLFVQLDQEGVKVPDPTILDNVCVNLEEQRLYTLIMDYRKTMKLPPIPLSAKLSKVAQTHTKDLTNNYEFSFTNECNPHSWSAKGSWTPCCYTADHKQASCMWSKPKEISGYPGNGYEIAYYSSGDANAFEALDGWKRSDGHNPLLVNSGIWSKVQWKAIGVGIYHNYGVVWFGEVADDAKPDNCNEIEPKQN